MFYEEGIDFSKMKEVKNHTQARTSRGNQLKSPEVVDYFKGLRR